MTISYLGNNWSQITREERYFTSILFNHAKANPSTFAALVANHANLILPSRGPWDLGFEVCFYRDFLWQKGRAVGNTNFSDKRTFDLCLFHEHSIVIIEAKVCESFKSEQIRSFAEDIGSIRSLLEQYDHKPEIQLIALASSKYFRNQQKYGRSDLLKPFAGHFLTWECLAKPYEESLFTRADDLYKMNHP